MNPPSTTDPVAGLLTFRRYTWWSLLSGNVVVLGMSAFMWGALPHAPGWVETTRWFVLVGVMAVSVPLVQHLLAERGDGASARPSRECPRPWTEVAVALAGVLGAVLLVGGEPRTWAVAPAVVACLLLAYGPPATWWRRSWFVLGGAVVLAALPGLIRDGQLPETTIAWTAGVVVFVLSITLVQVWTWEIAAQLDQARRVAGQLAVADERLRFAADLHDIQGHHLQVIALKAELAARLVPDDADRAASELREIQQLATTALEDTRAVVQGYRRTSLDTEIANATQVLASAGIDGRMRLDPAVDVAGLPDPVRHLLGLVVREATTNILRHSSAERADLVLDVDDDGTVRLTVTNDGLTEHDRDLHGGGLSALDERLRAAGGGLTWSRAGARFVVEAELPPTDRAEAAT